MTDINTIWQGWKAEELLGQGSYGKVYKMVRTELGHSSYAAAKLIEIPQDASEINRLSDMGMDKLSIMAYFKDTAQSIINEIAVMESLKGASNVVGIEDYQLIEHEGSIGWTICIRMELLQSLIDYQKDNGFPDADEVVRIGIDICNALATCEEVGIIHRDVKPENVFRSSFGDYKLGDFGISRQIESNTKSVYSQKGTGPYMAPEVMRRQKYGNSVDVYSLGIMLYRFLNNMRFPFLPPAPESFTADDMDDAMLKRLRGDELPAPSEADSKLAEIVLKACKADKDERYQSASELRDDLIAYRDGRYLTDEDKKRMEEEREREERARIRKELEREELEARLKYEQIARRLEAEEYSQKLAGISDDDEKKDVEDKSAGSSPINMSLILIGAFVVSVVAGLAGLGTNTLPIAIAGFAVAVILLALLIRKRVMQQPASDKTTEGDSGSEDDDSPKLNE